MMINALVKVSGNPIVVDVRRKGVPASVVVTRSMIFHEDACLSVTSPSADREEIFLTADSEEGMPVSGRDRIVVSRSPLEARLIKIKPVSFYGVINQKLMNRR